MVQDIPFQFHSGNPKLIEMLLVVFSHISMGPYLSEIKGFLQLNPEKFRA